MNIKNLMPLRALIAMATIIVSLYIHAQSVTHEYNGIRVGDLVEKHKTDPVSPGESGEDVLWDFSRLECLGKHAVEFFCDSDSVEICELEPAVINKYSFSADSLLMTGYENPLKKVSFSQPVMLMSYPFHYGDTFSAPYSGTGSYCSNLTIESSGMMEGEADGTGMLILPKGDTIRNVIRVHSIRTGGISMYLDTDSMSADRSRMKQEIEERYQWYGRGYRYPLLETSSISYYDDMTLVSCIQSSCLYSPDMQGNLHDEQNDSIQHADSLHDHQKASPDIITYTVSVSGSTVHVRYSLSEQASITALVCNHRGMTYRRSSCTMPAGDGYEMSIDCSGLTPDFYILYINVNGKAYSEKITIQ